MKKKCVDNGWSGFIAGNNEAIFKACGYDLTPNKLKKNPFNVPFYIHLDKKPAEPAFGKWEFVDGMNFVGSSAENVRYFEKRDITIEDLKRHTEFKGFNGFTVSVA